MKQEGLESGAMDNIENWYEVSYTKMDNRKGRKIDCVMDVLAGTHADALAMAEKCMEPGERVSFVTYRGTREQYDLQAEEGDMFAEWELDDQVDLTYDPDGGQSPGQEVRGWEG